MYKYIQKGYGELRAKQRGIELNLNVERWLLKQEKNKIRIITPLQLIETKKSKKNKETKLSGDGDTVLANTLPIDPELIIAYNIAENGIHQHNDGKFKPYI